jgi:hypothetical protein
MTESFTLLNNVPRPSTISLVRTFNQVFVRFSRLEVLNYFGMECPKDFLVSILFPPDRDLPPGNGRASMRI